MLVTLLIANSLKIGNHNLDTSVNYIADLELRAINLRRGLSADSCTIEVPRQALTNIEPLVYLTTGESLDISVYDGELLGSVVWRKVFSGYVSNLAEKDKDIISIKVTSKYSLYQNQQFLPKVNNVCQNQVYSKNCTLDKSDYTVSFEGVSIDCLTGKLSYTLTNDFLVLNGISSALPEKLKGRSITDFNQAYVILGNGFKSRVLGVTISSIFIDLNFMLTNVVTNVSLVLGCDKSYGTCYSKFSNIKNFYGFCNLSQQDKNYNIFTSEALEYCGDFESSSVCSTDDVLFGVTL